MIKKSPIILFFIFFIPLELSNYFSKNDFKYSLEEYILVAKTLYGECTNCSFLEHRLMASVIINRVNSKNYPNSIEEVIFQKKQFQGKKNEYNLKTLQASIEAINNPIKNIYNFLIPEKSSSDISFILNKKIKFKLIHSFY